MQFKHVLLLFARRYNPAIHRGVAKRAARLRWHLSMVLHAPDRPLTGLRGVRGVILGDRFDAAVVASLRASGVPVVNLSSDPEDDAGARVEADHRAIGELAAAYLLGRRFRHFAYCGDAGSAAARRRRRAFVEALAREGRSCRVIEGAAGADDATTDREAEMRAWQAGLAKLPAPAAVFCFNDILAARVLDAALSMGRKVPEELAVLGVDDDELVCEHAPTPLSSVRHPLEELGARGAELLAAIMAGGDAPGARRPPAPTGVTTRRSTECFAVAHPTLQAILLHLDRHHARALSLPDIARAAGVSPRTVQALLKEELGSTVTEEIQKRRLAHAQRLLAGPGPTVADVAALTGFASATYFHQAFKRHAGVTPREYRRRCLAAASG